MIARWKAALGEVEAGLPVHARNVIRTRLAQLSTIGDWDPVVAHGDFAPVNIVLDDAGQIAALLDLDRVGPGPPDIDVAWWGWVVRHHHPEVWRASMITFLEAAGADNESAARERRAALVLAALTGRGAQLRRPRPRHLDGATGGRDRLGRRRRVTPAPRGRA